MNCIICGSKKHNHVFNKDGFELVKCSICGLVFVSNQPTLEQLKSNYSDDPEYHSKYLDPSFDFSVMFSNASQDLKYLERFSDKGRLLDVGCSAGFFLKVAEDVGWNAHGVELNENTAAVARNRFFLNVKTGVLEHDDFPKHSFDAVTLWDLIEHLPDPKSFLNEISTILKPGAILAMRTPNIDGLFPRLSSLLKNKLDYWPHPEPPGHLYQFSVKTISSLLVSCGFKVEAVKHETISLQYSFGKSFGFGVSVGRALYSLVFAPFALLGPFFRSGDSIVVIARKQESL